MHVGCPPQIVQIGQKRVAAGICINAQRLLLGGEAIPFDALVVATGTRVRTLPDTPDGTVTFVAQRLVEHHPEVIWTALPESYRQDLTEVTAAFAEKMDPASGGAPGPGSRWWSRY